jgi:hypothetical protein
VSPCSAPQAAYEKLPIAETVAAVKRQTAVIEGELQSTLKAFIATQPSLASLNDPVVLQLLVYTVMGLPLLLLAVVLLSLVGGPRKGASSTAQGKGKKLSGGGKAAGVQGGARKGKSIKAGKDVLHYA